MKKPKPKKNILNMKLLTVMLLLVCVASGQYSNGRDAMLAGLLGASEILTPQKEKAMERQINQAMNKLKKMKRFTWSNESFPYIYLARFSWYPTQEGGSAGRYELDKTMFDQMKRSWFTDITVKEDTAYVPNVNLDSSVVDYSIFVTHASEKYIREHKLDTSFHHTVGIDTIDTVVSGSIRILSQKEATEHEIERQKRKLDILRKIENRTFRVIKFINSHTILIDRKPSFEIEELQSEIKPQDYIEGLCNCYSN